MSSFWAELKRRRVIRATIIYAVVAWALIQIAEVGVPALLLPDWVITLVTFLLILGFPVMLILAWAYDISPSGIRLTGSAEEADTVPRPPADESSIAVLPFANTSADSENGFFSDGLSEELSNALVNYEWNVGTDKVMDAAVDVSYMAETTGGALAADATRSFTVANARIGFGVADGRWRVLLWSRNITDEYYYPAAYQGGNGPYIRSLGMPRTYGVTLDYKFGAY